MNEINTLFETVRTIHPLTLALALIASAGVLLIAMALGVVCGLNLNLGNRISLSREGQRLEGEAPDADSFTSRVLAPLIEQVIARTGEREREWVERAYDLLDRKRGSSEYYVKKVICAIAGFVFGILLGLNFSTSGDRKSVV